MTKEEFNKIRWSCGKFCKYRGEWFPVLGVNFEEYLIWLCDDNRLDENDSFWIRCENLEELR